MATNHNNKFYGGKSAQFLSLFITMIVSEGGGRVVRWRLVNFQCRGVLLIWQGPFALAVGAGGGCLDIFLSFISPSL